MGLFPPGPEMKGWPEGLACLALVATRTALPDARGTSGHLGAPAEERLGVPPVCKYCSPQPRNLMAQGSLPRACSQLTLGAYQGSAQLPGCMFWGNQAVVADHQVWNWEGLGRRPFLVGGRWGELLAPVLRRTVATR